MNLQTKVKNCSRAGVLALLMAAVHVAAGYPGARASDTAGDRQELSDSLRALVAGFRGDAGVYVYHFERDLEIAVHADTLFPTASMVKVPILATVFQRIDDGDLALDEELTYRDSLYYPGADILGSFKDGETIQLGKVVMLMMTMSDNTASLWLQDLAGTGTYINEWLAENGFSFTRVNSRTEGRQENWQEYGWGQATPREMARLVTMIRNGEAVSAEASRRMYRFMTRNYWSGEALSAIPPWVQVASKNGSVSRSKSEVMLVNAPSGDYVFCVMTKNQEDAGYERDNEGFVLIRDVSRLLWEAFGTPD